MYKFHKIDWPHCLSHNIFELLDKGFPKRWKESNTIEFFVYLVHHSGNSRLVLSSVLNILWNFLFEENVNNKKKGGKDNVDTNNIYIIIINHMFRIF